MGNGKWEGMIKNTLSSIAHNLLKYKNIYKLFLKSANYYSKIYNKFCMNVTEDCNFRKNERKFILKFSFRNKKLFILVEFSFLFFFFFFFFFFF